MSQKPNLREIANRIEKNARGWLPIVGDVVNVTFTLSEAEVVREVLLAASNGPRGGAA